MVERETAPEPGQLRFPLKSNAELDKGGGGLPRQPGRFCPEAANPLKRSAVIGSTGRAIPAPKMNGAKHCTEKAADLIVLRNISKWRGAFPCG